MVILFQSTKLSLSGSSILLIWLHKLWCNYRYTIIVWNLSLKAYLNTGTCFCYNEKKQKRTVPMVWLPLYKMKQPSTKYRQSIGRKHLKMLTVITWAGNSKNVFSHLVFQNLLIFCNNSFFLLRKHMCELFCWFVFIKRERRGFILYSYFTIEGYKPTVNVTCQLRTEVSTQLCKD